MDIALKDKIAEKIRQIDDDALLNEIKFLIDLSESDFWTDVPTGVNRAVSQAKEELDRGEGIPHLAVIAEIKTRFLNKYSPHRQIHQPTVNFSA